MFTSIKWIALNQTLEETAGEHHSQQIVVSQESN